jgi:hypothetical protein
MSVRCEGSQHRGTAEKRRNMPRWARVRRIAACVTVLAFTCSSVAPALAYNFNTHQAMVDLAYQIMRAANHPDPVWRLGPNPLVPGGASVPPDWSEFLSDLSNAVLFWASQETGLPSDSCAPVAGTLMRELPVAPTEWWSRGPGSPCMDDKTFGPGEWGYAPGGILNHNDVVFMDPAFPGAGRFRDHTGAVLGWLGGNIDYNFDDTHMWYKPQSAAGLGVVKDFVDDAVDFALGAVFAPFICMFDWVDGEIDCWEDSKNAGDAANPGDDLEALIPGVGDESGSDWVGVWHYIQMGGQTDEFDDRPGYSLEDSGPGVGAIDMTLMILGDATGLSLNYDDSDGPKKYQISNGGDGHRDTDVRSKSDWQFLTFGHLTYEPVDNLAHYGWSQWRNGGATGWVGYPLHALGDAVAPHHVAGSPGWGHRPYEDAQEQRWLWTRLVREPGSGGSDDSAALQTVPAPGSNLYNLQKAYYTSVLLRAYEYRKWIKEWRASHPGNGNDVPVRDLVTLVAKNAYEYSMSTYASSGVPGWPFNDTSSVVYLADEGAAIKTYAQYPNNESMTRELIKEGAAATIAFLMSAPEARQ